VLATLYRCAGSDATAARAAAESDVRALLSRLRPVPGDAPPDAALPLEARLAALCAAASGDVDELLLAALAAQAAAAGPSLAGAAAAAQARLAALRLEARLRRALAAEGGEALGGALDALRAFDAFDRLRPPVASQLRALAARAEGRRAAAEQVAAARGVLADALAPYTAGVDRRPDAVGAPQRRALTDALAGCAAVAWPWQLAAEAEAARGVAARWAALAALQAALQLRPPPPAERLEAVLAAAAAAAPDAELGGAQAALAAARAREALAAGDSRLQAYFRAWLDAGGAAASASRVVVGLRESLAVSEAEHTAVSEAVAATADGAGAEAEAAAAEAAEAEAPVPAPPAAEPPVDARGWRVVGGGIRYCEAEVLGRGSAGTFVFLGEVARTSRGATPAAVKRVVRPPGAAGAAALRLLEREVELLAALGGGGGRAVAYLGWAAEQDHLYIAAELCGESLAQRCGRAPPPPLQERLRLCRDAAAALAWLHGQGVVHNDVSAANLLLPLRGPGLKLADLGLAVRCGEAAPAPAQGDAAHFSLSTFAQYGVTLNPARARPPELAAGARLTPAVDVHSLGGVFFELLAGGDAAGPWEPGRGGRLALGALMARMRGAPRRALEARHLIACMLQAAPEARPSAQQALRHPLFWSAREALAAAKALHEGGSDADARLAAAAARPAACGAAVERGALLAAACCDLQGWRARAEGPLLRRMAAAADYDDSFSGLLRLARNALEHPPSGREAALLAAATAAAAGQEAPPARRAASVEQRREALAEYLLALFPALAIAVHECGAEPPESEALRPARARGARGGSPPPSAADGPSAAPTTA